MAGQNLAGISAILKTQYVGMLRDALQRIFWTWAHLKKGSLEWAGDSIKWPVRFRGTNAMSWGPGGSALNAAQRQVTVSSEITVKQAWLPIEFTFDAYRASRNGKGAFINAMALEMDKGVEDFRDMMERVVWGDGTGKIAEVESYAAGTVTCSAMSDAAGASGVNANAGCRYIKQGMILDFYSSANVARHYSAVVTSVDHDNEQFDIAVGTGDDPVATDGIYLARPDQSSPISQEPMGIPGLIDDGTLVATLQGISRTTYPQWAANLLVASGAAHATRKPLTGELAQRALDKATEAGGGSDITFWCANDVKREFIKLGETDVRFKPRELNMGISENNKGDGTLPKNSLHYNGFKVCWAPDTPWGTLFVWPDGFIRQYPMFDGPAFVPNNPDGSGGILQRKTGVAGTYEAQLCWMGNLGTDVVSASRAALIRYISSTIDRVHND